MKQKTQFGAILLLGAFALGGCASTGEIDQLRSDIERAQSTADDAAAEAAAARSEAAAARRLAEEAQDDAAAAKARSEETDAKIDRMFKKSMYK
ncbi:Lpp/OprI family alanine-zipper lipoprotein [Thiohalobacter thiocyanaticus]|uniref:Lipoprotein n=1 Tax=Thiohalobacter thiocyanaticus TaxID=585455 RepID=A0A426QFY0_9GAMM|nr:Lpp/OprI family alanine-zipper lipoprotein [Thiohalobacter thiocyanaticus]RRQ20652.1 hypothetical protein D6C00_00740 [Thiohalobacter thiocyanaticus]